MYKVKIISKSAEKMRELASEVEGFLNGKIGDGKGTVGENLVSITPWRSSVAPDVDVLIVYRE